MTKRKYNFIVLSLCAGWNSENVANHCAAHCFLRKRGPEESGGSRVFQWAPQKEKMPEKSSAGPDFLGFAQKIDIILKKHMFFDKKYILFSLY